jgi:hypothetical protein
MEEDISPMEEDISPMGEDIFSMGENLISTLFPKQNKLGNKTNIYLFLTLLHYFIFSDYGII